jgi:phosphate transport system permease protein
MVPAAASGILAACLIGFGRALGETMIVLMVSSNTPLMEPSLLRGLQAIAPTLATEMPEASPSSVHYRVLLLAALTLFLFTFLMNSTAEFFRLRLRRRYQA